MVYKDLDKKCVRTKGKLQILLKQEKRKGDLKCAQSKLDYILWKFDQIMREVDRPPEELLRASREEAENHLEEDLRRMGNLQELEAKLGELEANEVVGWS